jgi:hypothetical protein
MDRLKKEKIKQKKLLNKINYHQVNPSSMRRYIYLTKTNNTLASFTIF